MTADPRAEPNADLERLVIAASNGDGAALSEALAIVIPLAKDYCAYSLSRTNPAYPDIVQETCIAAAAALTTYQPREGGSFQNLLWRIARNKAVDAFRATALRPVLLDEFPDSPHSAPGPEHYVVAKDFVERALAPIAAFTPTCQAVVFLHILHGLTSAETAEELGITAGNVRVLRHRAFTSLRRRFGGAA
jgi:RNA polymerase sigma-70 factor (ECF subfamily)